MTTATPSPANPLTGRTVVVTGVSRRAGIGHAIACRAADLGASLLCHHFSPHDAEQPWGADSVEATLDSVRAHLVPGARLVDVEADFRDQATPPAVIDEAVRALGGVDALVCNQASSGRDGGLQQIDAADLDHHWAVNARASLLLVQAYAEHAAGRYEAEPDGGSDESGGGSEGAGSSGSAVLPGSVVLMTSGQGLGPMPEEIAYCTAKAALAGITPSLAAGLAERGIRLNTVNPGPVNTGYMDAETMRMVDAMFPCGRTGRPEDAARLICWLLTDEASWVTGQVINSEGGFARWRR